MLQNSTKHYKTLQNIEIKSFCPPPFSAVKTVKEASAVCLSFLDGVVIFFDKRFLWQFSEQYFSYKDLYVNKIMSRKGGRQKNPVYLKTLSKQEGGGQPHFKKMTTPSRKLRHTAEASLTVFTERGGRNTKNPYFNVL